MSKPHITYTATHKGQSFSVTSVRPITHAVVATIGPRAIEYFRDNAQKWAAAKASGEYGSWTVEEIAVAYDRAISELEKAETIVAGRLPWGASFHASPALAAKEAARKAKDGWFADVTIVATTIPVSETFQAKMDSLFNG